MPHEDFFEATLIEFSTWEKGKEVILKKYEKFDDIPKEVTDELDEESPRITFKGKKWKVLGINQNKRAHGKGIHIKVRIEKET